MSLTDRECTMLPAVKNFPVRSSGPPVWPLDVWPMMACASDLAAGSYTRTVLHRGLAAAASSRPGARTRTHQSRTAYSLSGPAPYPMTDGAGPAHSLLDRTCHLPASTASPTRTRALSSGPWTHGRVRPPSLETDLSVRQPTSLRPRSHRTCDYDRGTIGGRR